MTQYRIKPIIKGVKTRYQIQKRSVIFFLSIWKPLMNPIVSPIEPFEFKIKSDAEKKLSQLSKV